MRSLFQFTVMTWVLLLAGTLVSAGPSDFACQGGIAKLRQAQQTVQAQQREVENSRRGQRLASAELEVCKPGEGNNG